MGNVSLKVLEFFVQKRVQNLLTIPTSQNKSEPTMVSATPRNTGMVVLEELRITGFQNNLSTCIMGKIWTDIS